MLPSTRRWPQAAFMSWPNWKHGTTVYAAIFSNERSWLYFSKYNINESKPLQPWPGQSPIYTGSGKRVTSRRIQYYHMLINVAFLCPASFTSACLLLSRPCVRLKTPVPTTLVGSRGIPVPIHTSSTHFFFSEQKEINALLLWEQI